uniref:dehydrogenase n=1 Tax=Streptomyces sp. TaxID=1931 RepID=UPI0028118970
MPRVPRTADPYPSCPECGKPLTAGGLVLSADGDGRRACRSLRRCADRHTWWRWTHRPDDPLELCPVPELF